MKNSQLWILQVLTLFCFQMPTSESTATLTIFFQGFQNGFERKWDGQCCDSVCSYDPCDILYSICFNDSSAQPECLTKVYNVYSISENTLTYHMDSWQGNLPVKVLVYDIDAGRNEFVDYFTFALNLSSVPSSGSYPNLSTSTHSTSVQPATGVTQLPGNSSFLMYPGIRQYFRTNLLLNAVVTCDDDYYTQRCDVYCVNSNTCSGHYTCDLTTGQKVCQLNWTGPDCTVPAADVNCSLPTAQPANEETGPCQLVDLVVILDSSGSINNLDSNNWQYMKNFIKSIADRVTIGRKFFQIGVVTFGDSAQLNIKLSDGSVYSSLQNKIDVLPYLGQKTNLRSGLRLTRTEAFLARNGARPSAYRSVILVYDGEKPTAEFGTLANEASRMREMGIDVYVVSLNYFFSRGLATFDLVQNIASSPLNAHLFSSLDSWSRISNTVAPTILANIVDTCFRNTGTSGSGTAGSTTVPTIFPSRSVAPTGLPSSSVFPTGLPSSSALPTGLSSSSALPTDLPSSSTLPTGFPPSSALPTGLPSRSTLPTGLPSSSALPTGLSSSSALPTGLPTSSALPTGLPSSSALPTGLSSSSALPTGLPTSSALPTGLSSSSALPTGLSSSSALPTGLPTSSALPTGLSSSSALPTGLSSSSALPTGLPTSSALPTGLSSSSALPTGLSSSSALPTGLPTSSALPTGLSSSSALPTGLPSRSTIPTGLFSSYRTPNATGPFTVVTPSATATLISPTFLTSLSGGRTGFTSILSTTFLSSTSGVLQTTDEVCSYRGTCGSDSGANVCCCQPGYVGNYCEYEDDPCASNPCNGGSCNRIDRLSFSCSCLPGFSGDRCQIVGAPISACDTPVPTSAPLSQCSSIPPAPCTEFYYGSGCITFCRPENTCIGHYSCSSTGQKVCLSGWKNVSADCLENDGYVSTECSKNCLNGGFCFSGICCCLSGFTGEQCENQTGSPASSATPTGLPSTVPTGLASSSAVPTGLLSSSAVPTSLISTSTIPTGIKSSSTVPTGLASSSTVPTGLASSSTVPTGIKSSSTVPTGLASSSTVPTGIASSSAIATGLTSSSAVPTGIKSTVPTGITSSLAAPTGLTSRLTVPTVLTSPTLFPSSTLTSESTMKTTSSQIGVTSLSVPSTTSSTSFSSISTSTSVSTTASTSTSTAAITSTTTLPTTMGTTLSEQERIIQLLREYIKNNFPNLSPVEQQQLLNELLSKLIAPSALSVEYSSNLPPIYVSLPWPGSGRLANFSIQLEVIEAIIIRGENGTLQLKLKYDYILKELYTGNEKRIMPEEYQRLTYEVDDVPTDVSLLDSANRLQIVVYGSHLDYPVRRKFSVALRNAYGQLNPGWTAKMDARIVIGEAVELIAITGEDLTLLNFWLVSGSSDSESHNSIIIPRDLSITTELLNLGVVTSLCRSVAWFKVIDAYDVFVKGVVYYEDMPDFTQILMQYWKNTLRIPNGYTVKMVKQEKCFLSSSVSHNPLVTRLIYFVYNSTSFDVLPKSLAFVPPTSEHLPTLTSVDGRVYELVQAADTATSLPLKQAFFVTVLDHPVDTTFPAIQMILQERIQEFPIYSTAEVKVLGADEYFSVNKRVSFNRIFWYLFNNGSLIDSRRFVSRLPTMAEWSILLQGVKLPNGRHYRYVTDDLSADVVVRRSECFFQPVDDVVLHVENFEKVLTNAVQKEQSELTNSASMISVAYVEEYVNNTGSTAWVIFFIIKSPNADSYLTILDASIIFSELISTTSLASNMQLNKPDGSEYLLLNKTAVSQMARYVSLLHLFLKQRPLARDLEKFSTSLTTYYKKKISSVVNVRILTVEEFLDPNGSSFWSIGYSVSVDGKIVWPEALEYANSSEIATSASVVAATGNLYSSVLNGVENFARAKDMYSFHVTFSLSREDLKLLEKFLAQAFKSGFPEFFQSLVETDVTSVEELLASDGGSVFRIYYRLFVDHWPVLAQNHDAINKYNLSVFLPSFVSSRLWYGDSNSLTKVSSLSVIVMNRVMFQEDLAQLELTLKSAVALALQNTGNSFDQFLLSVKRQRECILLSGSLEWAVDFSASLAGEPLYPGLLPVQLVNTSAIEFSLASNSVVPKYKIIDFSPQFIYEYEKSFQLLLNWRANVSLLSSLQTILTQGYTSVNPKSDVEVKVAAIEEVIVKINRPLIDMPSIWQVLYYVSIDGVTLNRVVDEPLNASFINSLIAQSSVVDKEELYVLHGQNLEIVRVQQCLKLLFAGKPSSSDLVTLGEYVEAGLQEGTGIRNASASALQRLEKISQDGRIFTEVRVSIKQNGKVLEGNLIRRVFPNNRPLQGTYIPDPASSLHVSLYEKSQLFSIGFQSPILGLIAYNTLEKSLEQIHGDWKCINASVRIVKQFESLNQSGSSLFVILYVLTCNGITQDATNLNQVFALDDLWVVLSAAGFQSQLFEGDKGNLIAVEHLLGIPFTTFVSPLDYSAIEESLKQSATSLSLELSKVAFEVLDQRTYLDEQGNFYYMLLCSALINSTVLDAVDFLPLLNLTTAGFERIVGPAGSNYRVSHSDYFQFRPLKSAAVIYFDWYLPRDEESKLLFAVVKSVAGLEEKYENLTAQVFAVDRVVHMGMVIYRYIIFLTSEVMPSGFPVDLALESPVNATILSASLSLSARTGFSALSVMELRKSFRLNILGYVAETDVPRFKQRLQLLWNCSISDCLVEEYFGVKGETVTGLSYFVFKNGEIVDPTSIQAPSASSMNSVLFAALPEYRPYTRDVFLQNNAFCFLVDGDSSTAMEDWLKATGSSQSVPKLLAIQLAFGLYGSPFTRVCYSASSANGVRLLPGRDPAPINRGPDTNETVVRADTLYSLTVHGSLTEGLIFRLAQQLTSAWIYTAGNEVSVNVYGVEVKLIASEGTTLVTRIYYGITCNGSMLRPVDRPAPSLGTYMRNMSLDLYEGETVKLHYVVLQDPRSTSNITERLVRAITIAWNNVSGSTVKVKIPVIRHQMYTVSLLGFVMKVYYGVTLLNDKDVDTLDSVTEPTALQLSGQLQAQGLKGCSCAIWRGFNLYVKEPAASLKSKLNVILNALRKAWSSASPDVSQSEFTIRVNLNEVRKKRATDNSYYEDVDGNLLSRLEYQVKVRGHDPDPLFIPFPSDSSVARSLSEVAGISVCTSCTLQQCGELYISGALTDKDKISLVHAITNAFASANQPDFVPTDVEIVIKSVTVMKDSTGAYLSRVSYCMQWTTNSTLPALAIPSFDQMSEAVLHYDMKQVDPGMIDASEEKFSYNTKVAIIVACCVGGLMVLAIVAAIIGRILYQKRKLEIIPTEQDEQRLSVSDGDTFVGHGLYNPSPYNSLHKSGPVESKLQFCESTGSDISI